MAKKKTIRTIPQERTPMREQDPKVRAKNFAEVACGYRLEDAMREAERCLMCPEEPCIKGCPVSINIPGLHQEDQREELSTAPTTPSPTPICCRRCAAASARRRSSAKACARSATSLEPVAIGRLERFVGDMAIAEGWANVPYIEPNGYRVAIVGSGPAGMACAADMAKAGCDVTVYEAFHEAGGVLKYGIPEFRLPNDVVDAEIGKLAKLGIKFECNTLVGRLFTIEQMVTEMGYDAVFIGVGAGYPSFMGIPGESLDGVLSANEMLTRCNLMHAREFPNYDTPVELGRRVAVIGAGNTAMDALRVSLRLGAEQVHCIYRRSKAEAPARAEEIHHAEEEGDPVPLAHQPGRTARRRQQEACAACAASAWSWASPTLRDGAGRSRSPAANTSSSATPWSTRSAPMPIRSSARPRSSSSTSGAISTPTTISRRRSSGVYAGGDIVTGAATVILAMGAGRKAARSMKAYLGLRDSDVVYLPERVGSEGKLFGIDQGERNFARLRLG